MRSLGKLVLGCLFFSSCLSSAEIKVVSWNVESGQANPSTFKRHFLQMNGIDFYGLSEVESGWITELDSGIEAQENTEYESIVGSTGGADRLVIFYNKFRFELLSKDELKEINIGGKVRAPLVGKFRDNVDKGEFYVMVNHLYRSNNQARHSQAALINEWAAKKNEPIITMGDFNFDWEVKDGEAKHDKGFDNLIANGVFSWIRPKTLIKTQCSPQYDSVLDFVFVSGRFKSLQNDATILLDSPSYCTTNTNEESDHRPIFARIVSGSNKNFTNKDALMERLNKLETEIKVIRELAEKI